MSSHRKSTITTTTERHYYRILLVDDEPDILFIFKRGLEINGFSVDAFDSPQNAINSFKPNVYDLAILDIQMPDMNGFALYRQIKKIDPAITGCFLSAFEVDPDEYKQLFPSMGKGVRPIIRKPISIRHLLKAITPFLKMSAQIRSKSGEHVLVVYETPMEMIEQSLEFLKNGIVNNEDVMIVTDVIPIDSLREKVAKEWKDLVINLDNMEQEGRITLHTFQEWYMPDGKFDLQTAIAKLTKKMQQTKEHGRKGFRCVGDMNPFFDMGMADEAVKYESTMEKNFNLPLIGFCAYTRDRFLRLDDEAVQLLNQCHSRIISAPIPNS
jgi:DNA-binding response OmpR family regulator